MIDPDTYIRSSILPTSTDDLRKPDADETPLSPVEVEIGMRDGTIPAGPRACRIVDVFVGQLRRVEVVDFFASEAA